MTVQYFTGRLYSQGKYHIELNIVTNLTQLYLIGIYTSFISIALHHIERYYENYNAWWRRNLSTKFKGGEFIIDHSKQTEDLTHNLTN